MECPTISIPYFIGKALRFDHHVDYASPKLLQNAVRYEWVHPLGEIITELN